MSLSSLFRWATSGTKTEPPAAVKSTGWTDGYSPPHEWVNWIYNVIGTWFTTGGVFATPEAAYAALEDGEQAWVREAEDENPLTVKTAVTLGSSFIPLAVCGDGVYWHVAGSLGGNAVGYKFERDIDSGQTIQATYTCANTGTTPVAIATNGQYVAIANGQYVDCFTAEDGTHLWTFDHGANVAAVAVAGDSVYVAGADTGSAAVHRVAISGGGAGTATWSYDHSADVSGIAVAFPRVFFTAAASSHGSGAKMRALNYQNGADAANEGGTGADTTGVAWDSTVPSGALLWFRADGKRLYGYVSGTVYSYSPVDGSQLASQAGVPGEAGIAVGDRHIYVARNASSTAYMYALDKVTLDLIGKSAVNSGIGPYVGENGMAFDGAAGVIVSNALTNNAARFAALNPAPRLWERTDFTSNQHLPWRGLIHPVEID